MQSANTTQFSPILKILSWLTLLISVISFFSALNNDTYGKFFSSDTVGLPAAYQDLADEGGKLKDWYFAAAPTLFPDYAIYALVQGLLHLKVAPAMFVYAILQTLLLAALLAFIFKKTAPCRINNYGWLIPLLFSTFFMEAFYFSKDVFVPILIVQFSYHTGSFINALISLALHLCAFNRKWIYALLFFFSALASFSDLLYIPMFTIPFLITELLLLKKDRIKLALLAISSVTLGSLAGLLIYRYAATTGLSHFVAPHRIYDFNNIGPSFEIFYDQVIWYISIPGPRSVFFMLTIFAIPALAILLFKKRKSMDATLKYFLVFSFIFLICVIFAPIINGNYTGLDTLRYNLAAFLLFTNLLALLLAHVLNRFVKTDKGKKISAYAFVCSFLILVTTAFSKKGFNDYFDFKPDIVKEIDSICNQKHVKNGISEYWNAKLFTAFSDHDIKLRAVYPDANINVLGSNTAWYHQNDFDFVVVNQLDENTVRSKLRITDSVQTSHYKIFLTKKFTYPGASASPLSE